MTDDELDDALRSHYRDRLPADREAHLVGQVARRRGRGMAVLIGVAAIAVLWLAVSARTRSVPETPALAPEGMPTKIQSTVWLLIFTDEERATLDLEGSERAPAALLPVAPWPEGTGSVVANPTLIARSGQAALMEWTVEEHTTRVELTVTEAGPEWRVDVALTAPSREAPFTWTGSHARGGPGMAFVLDEPVGSWGLRIEIAAVDEETPGPP